MLKDERKLISPKVSNTMNNMASFRNSIENVYLGNGLRGRLASGYISMKSTSSKESELAMRHVRSIKSRVAFDPSWMEDFDEYDAKLLGHGSSAIVLAVSDKLAIKLFAEGSKQTRDLDREHTIFLLLNASERSPNIVQFFGRWERGIVLERGSMTLRQRLRLGDVTAELQDRWILESSRGLAFLHLKGVLHGDFGSQNILIDAHDNAKICDFAGSKMGDQEAWVRYQVRNQHPKYEGRQPTIATEIFALGSVIFEIITSQAPYETLSDSAVQKRFQEGRFPLESIGRPEMRKVVEGCWKGTYVKVLDICDDLY